MPRIAPETQDEAVRLYAEGENAAAVGRKLNIDQCSVFNILKRRGMRHKRKGYDCMRYAVSLTGTRAVCEAFKAFVKQYADCNPSVCQCRSVWVCMVGSLRAIKAIVPVLYGKATVWMARKRKRAEEAAARPILR